MTNAQVKECREKDIKRLMERTGLAEKECRRIMTSFYRLSIREYRLLELDNNEYYYTRHRKWLESENERNYNWMVRLNEELKPYGLKVGLRGGYAHLDIFYPDTTGVSTFTDGYYYR